jgi:hypothetical protein
MCDRCVEWGGHRWHRYREGRGSYYERTDKSVRPKRTLRLHREVWIKEHGPILPGFEVHHRDNDMANNDPSNLECLEKGRHSARHRETLPIPRADLSNRCYRVQCLDCGAALERKINRPAVCKSCQGRRAVEKRKRERACAHCARLFVSDAGHYCSQRCVNLATHGGTRSVLPDGRRRS